MLIHPLSVSSPPDPPRPQLDAFLPFPPLLLPRLLLLISLFAVCSSDPSKLESRLGFYCHRVSRSSPLEVPCREWALVGPYQILLSEQRVARKIGMRSAQARLLIREPMAEHLA